MTLALHTESEIRTIIKYAKNPTEQERICAQMNLVPLNYIREIIGRNPIKQLRNHEYKRAPYDILHQQKMDLYEQGLNDVEIAKQLGMTQPAICMWRKRHNLEMKREFKPKIERKTHYELHMEKIELYQKGLTDIEMAEHLKITSHGVMSWRKRNKLKRNKKGVE